MKRGRGRARLDCGRLSTATDPKAIGTRFERKSGGEITDRSVSILQLATSNGCIRAVEVPATASAEQIRERACDLPLRYGVAGDEFRRVTAASAGAHVRDDR